MHDLVLRLYPLPSVEEPLRGLYLAHNLRQYGQRMTRAFVYANFVTSLDGRIAIPSPSGKGLMVPKNTANDHDWRLTQELTAQADLVLTTGRYLRDLAKGRGQKILQLDEPQFADLRDWRRQRGLLLNPDIAILTSSLRFPIPDELIQGNRVVVFTIANPDSKRVAEIQAKLGRVIVVGENSIEGEKLLQQITELGYRTIYSAAGPKVLHLLLEGRVLDRLYITHAHRILGSEPFASLVDGALLEPAVGFTLNTLYFDRQGLDGLGQLFISYNRA
ncbi:MAG TPA: dihydrofolate reductase family protein [Anaerolineae bacterium]|nr:dihydrofolate reductase family protein [Anaerolineae bacterium]